MKRLALASFTLILITLIGCSKPSASSNNEAPARGNSLKGKWQITKMDGQDAPPELVIIAEFMDEGRMKMTNPGGTDEGTYKVDGDTLTTVQKTSDGKQKTDVLTIKSNTGDKMTLVDEKRKSEMELTKQK